jgi:hypothetical protein
VQVIFGVGRQAAERGELGRSVNRFIYNKGSDGCICAELEMVMVGEGNIAPIQPGRIAGQQGIVGRGE